MYIKEIEKLRRDKNITVEELVKKIGVSRGTYYHWIKTDNMPINKLQSILDILNDGKPIANEARIIEDTEWMEVAYLPIPAQAGYLDSLEQDTTYETPETMIIPHENEKGTFIIVEVAGQSMNDGTDRSIKEGDKLLCKELHRDHWRNKLHYNQYLFVLMGRDGVVCKQITEHDLANARVRCHSYNELYKDYEVNLDELYKLYYVKKIVDRKVLI